MLMLLKRNSTMLVVTRRLGESLRIGDNIVIHIVKAEAPRARIGVDAPKEMAIRRAELEPYYDQASPTPEPPAIEQD
tara:strand:- start:5129 stop:5359 length:231 start_codon:yes stop_codon:yes gene_type:complete